MAQKYLTYYELLEVETNATTEQIIAAFKEKIKRDHPDKNNGSEASNTLTKYYNEAKTVLCDPVQRLHYDYVIGVKKRPEVRSTKNQQANSNINDLVAVGFFGLIVGIVLSSD